MIYRRIARAAFVSFRIKGLAPGPFRAFQGRSEQALAKPSVRRCTADRQPGVPDRIELRDTDPGETLLLPNCIYQPANNSYRASHAIIVLEGAEATCNRMDEVSAPKRVLALPGDQSTMSTR